MSNNIESLRNTDLAAVLAAFNFARDPDDKRQYKRESQRISVAGYKWYDHTIDIALEMIEASFKILNAKGLIGTKAEYTAILALFEKDSRPRTERIIVNAKIQTEPFKSHSGNKSALVKKTLKDMVEAKILSAFINDAGVTMYSLGQ